MGDDEAKDKKRKKEKKEKKEEKKNKEKGDDEEDDEDDEAKDKKRKKEKKEKKGGKENKEKKKDKGDEDTAKAKKGGDDDGDDLEFTDELIVESTKRLAKFVKEQETKGKLGKDKFFDEARMIQIQNAYSTKLRMYVALQSLFGEDMTKEGIKGRVPHLKMLASTPQMEAGDILAAFE